MFAVILQQAYASLHEKTEQWPLRIFTIRLIDSVGRITIFPVVTALFIIMIKEVDRHIRFGMVLVAAIITTVVLIREVMELRHCFKESVEQLIAKLNSDEVRVKQLSPMEILFVNIWKFNYFSTSPFYISNYLEQNGEFSAKSSKSPKLRRLTKIGGRYANIQVGDEAKEGDDANEIVNTTNEVFEEENPQFQLQEQGRAGTVLGAEDEVQEAEATHYDDEKHRPKKNRGNRGEFGNSPDSDDEHPRRR